MLAAGCCQAALSSGMVVEAAPASQMTPPVKAPTPQAPVQGAPAPSQSKGGAEIHGTVVEQDTERPLANVTVTFHTPGGREVEVETNKVGIFELHSLQPGTYSVTFALEGLLAQTHKILIHKNESAKLDVVLVPLETADLLRITGQRTLIHPESISNTTHVDKKYLEQIGNGNDLRTVIETTPGIMPDSIGNIITRGEHDSVNYTLDGAVLPETAGVLQQGQLASPRSLQSVDVNIGGYEASDGGGPMGAIVHMRSMPIESKPILNIGTQLGGPISGGMNYYGSTALSQDANSVWNRVRVESSGSIFASKLGLEPGTRQFRRDAKLDINSLTKIEYQATERDRFTLHVGINESYAHQPVSPISRAAGVKINEHDRQNYIMLSYRHRFKKFFDEGNLHLINSFYSQHIWQPNVFDPNPVINGDGFQNSAAINAKRYNFVVSAQGDISKTLFKTHYLKAGFLTNLRWVRTSLNEIVYDANPADATYGQVISPFLQSPGGPNFTGPMGMYHGSQWVQSAYIQDTWRPCAERLKRLTLDYGVRFDLADSLFGNSQALGNIVSQLYQAPFNMQPFQRQTEINAQASGRFGGTYALNRSTILRASFSNIFVPNPVDYFLTPIVITGGPASPNGIFNGSPRPLQAMRGRLVDCGVEKQVGRRFVMRQNLFYKKLYHFGDSGVIDNSIVYNRLTNNEQETYGAETRLELKPAHDGTGFYGYVSNTFAVAYLRGSRLNDGEFWITSPAATTKYPDHDRREVVNAALGWRNKRNWWILATVNAYTGVKNELDPTIYGPHPARVAPAYFIGLNAGMPVPQQIKRRFQFAPDSVEVRIQNLTSNVAAINLGSPFQGTRYSLPIRVLACANWKIL
jgi:hypothetical protein